MSKAYQIGELARRLDVPVETIRYYESQKLIPHATRTAGNYRQYEEHHVERLLFIRHCRSLDMSIAEIRQLLHAKDYPESSCDDVDAVIDEHIAQVTRRLSELRALRQQLLELRSCCAQKGSATDCGILAGLSTPARSEKKRQLPRKSPRRS